MRFKIKSGDTTFYIASADTNFVFQDNSDYTEYDVLRFTFNAETGDYQCQIENPSVSTQRAFDRNKLYLGISSCDITNEVQDHRKCAGTTQKRYRPYRQSSSDGPRRYWRVRNAFKVKDLSNISFNIHSIRIPKKLHHQGSWVLSRIDEYKWSQSTFKDKVTLDYKFILVYENGRAIKSYKTIYTVELTWEE